MCLPGWRGCLRRGRGEGQDRCHRDRSCSQSHLSCWCCRGWCHYHPQGSLYRTSEAELSTPYCWCVTCPVKSSVNFFTTVLHVRKWSRTNVYIFISLLRMRCSHADCRCCVWLWHGITPHITIFTSLLTLITDRRKLMSVLWNIPCSSGSDCGRLRPGQTEKSQQSLSLRHSYESQEHRKWLYKENQVESIK